MLNIFGLIPSVLAQTETKDKNPSKINLAPESDFTPLTEISVSGIISTFITVALIVAGVVFLFMLIIGGIRWILSGGDKAQTETARNQITAALIGLVVVFAAYAIANLIGTVFGLDNILLFTIPSIV